MLQIKIFWECYAVSVCR